MSATPDPALFDKVVNLCKRRGFVFPSRRDLRRLPVHLRLRAARRADAAQREERLVAVDGAAARRRGRHRRVDPQPAGGVGGVGPPGQLHRPARRLQELQGALPARQARRPEHLPELRHARTASPRPASSTSCSRPTPGPWRAPATRSTCGRRRPRACSSTSRTCSRPRARSRPSASPRWASRSATRSRPATSCSAPVSSSRWRWSTSCRRTRASSWYEYWCQQRHAWYVEHGIPADLLRLRPHDADELSHYSSGTVRRGVPLPVGLRRARGHRQPGRLRPHSSTPSTRGSGSSTSTRPPTSTTCRT